MNENRNYEVDSDEYRALFQRIENSSKRFADDNAEIERIKKEPVPEPVYKRPPVRKNSDKPAKPGKPGGFNINKVISSTKKKAPASGGKGGNGKRKLPTLTRLYRASVIMFAASLMLFGFISAVDKNKAVSETENRKLAEKPKFTFSSLFNGEYTVAFENFYSDNFPARDFFISCNTKISDLFTRFSAGENGEVVVQTQKNDEDFVGEGVDVLGDKKQLKKDKGMKENTAAVTPDSEASMQGSVLIAGNRALEIYYHSDTNAKNYADLMNKTAKSMPEGVRFFSMLCPTAVEFYGTAQYREGVHSQRDSIQKIYSMYDKNEVISVDAYSNLVDNVKDYIYFRSDHHWTARGAYCGYTAFCEASGNTAPKLESFATHRLDDFLGSLYRTSQATVLKDNPDYVECFDLSVDAQNMVYPNSYMNESDGVPTYVIANEVNDSNKYLAFIAGDQPLEKITTSVKNGKKILVIKESYGNALVPFLCNNYEEVYVIDPRWIDMNLADFVATNGINDVLAINYMFAIGNQKYTGALSAMTY